MWETPRTSFFIKTELLVILLFLTDLGSGVMMMPLAVSGSEDFCHTIAYWPGISEEEFHDHFGIWRLGV